MNAKIKQLSIAAAAFAAMSQLVLGVCYTTGTQNCPWWGGGWGTVGCALVDPTEQYSGVSTTAPGTGRQSYKLDTTQKVCTYICTVGNGGTWVTPNMPDPKGLWCSIRDYSGNGN